MTGPGWLRFAPPLGAAVALGAGVNGQPVPMSSSGCMLVALVLVVLLLEHVRDGAR